MLHESCLHAFIFSPAVLCVKFAEIHRNSCHAQAEQMTKQLQKLTPRQMSMILGAARVFQQVKQAIVTHKMLVLSIVVFVFALLLRWFNVL